MKIFGKLLIAVILFQCSVAEAQQLSISASVDKNAVAMNGQLILQVEVSGGVSNVPNPSIPKIEGFTSYSSGRSQSVSIVNGKVSSSVTFTYVLIPQAEGKHTIPAITINHAGQNYSTAPIDIEVLSSGGRSSQSQPSEPAPQVAHEARGDIFFTASTDKNKAYVNEQVTLTVSIFNRVNILSQPEYIPPVCTGFWSEDLPPQRNYRTTIDGREYNVVELKTALFPTSPGKYTIGKAQLRCTIEDRSSNTDDFFRGFFSAGKDVALETKPVIITVMPLPDMGKPSGFKGAVGQFRISSKVDKKEITTDDAVSLTVDVAGEGNVKAISEPVLSKLDNFRKYDTISSFNLSKTNYRVQGSKSYTTVLSPVVSGSLVVPPVEFSYFDPAEKNYKTIKTLPISINVKPGTRSPTASPVVNPAGIKYITKDILYIKTKSSLNDQGYLLYKKGTLTGSWFASFIVLAALLFYKKRLDRLSTDMSYARRTRATGMARKRLKKARELLDTENIKEFYAALSDGLTKYIGDKLNISVPGMTLIQLEEMLSKRKVDEELLRDIKDVLSRSDFARFAPSKLDKEQLKSDYELSEKLIVKLQKIL